MEQDPLEKYQEGLKAWIESREKLKKIGLEKTAHRIAKTWFVKERKF